MRALTQTDLLSAFKAALAIMAVWCAASDHVQAQTPSDDSVSLIVEGTKFCQAFLNGAQVWNVEDFGFTSMSSPTADSDGFAVSPEANVIITASAGQEPNCVVLLRSKTEDAKQVAQAMVDRLMNEGAYRLTTGPSQGATQVFWALLSNASAPSGGHIIAVVDAFLDPTAQANPSLTINFSLAN